MSIADYGFAIWETFYVTVLSTAFALVLGLPLGVLLVAGDKDGVLPLPGWLMHTLNIIINILGDNPSPFMISTVIFIAASILTQVMSNIPTILIFMPIGLSIAEKIGVSPYPIAMIITLAGAASYATPFAAPQNMMTVGWTKYKFLDFVKIGIPMVILTYIVVVALIPVFLPYH